MAATVIERDWDRSSELTDRLLDAAGDSGLDDEAALLALWRTVAHLEARIAVRKGEPVEAVEQRIGHGARIVAAMTGAILEGMREPEAAEG